MPGIRSSAAGMSPANSAMALVAMIAPSAGTGSIANVSGTSNAAAMVADRPGIAPTNIPKIEASRMTSST